MRIYKITADCLVDDCLCTWYVVARSERQAWAIGYAIANECNVADGGTVDAIRVPELPAGAKIADYKKKLAYSGSISG